MERMNEKSRSSHWSSTDRTRSWFGGTLSSSVSGSSLSLAARGPASLSVGGHDSASLAGVGGVGGGGVGGVGGGGGGGGKEPRPQRALLVAEAVAHGFREAIAVTEQDIHVLKTSLDTLTLHSQTVIDGSSSCLPFASPFALSISLSEIE